MKEIDIGAISHQQIKLVKLNNTEFKVFIKQNNFFAGLINCKRKIFYHVPRSQKNVFHFFGFEGLGINEEILLLKQFDTIMIKFKDEILSTPRLKWLRSGIASPYCNELVDKQLILPISKINLNEAVDTQEQNLFGEAI